MLRTAAVCGEWWSETGRVVAERERRELRSRSGEEAQITSVIEQLNFTLNLLPLSELLSAEFFMFAMTYPCAIPGIDLHSRIFSKRVSIVIT